MGKAITKKITKVNDMATPMLLRAEEKEARPNAVFNARVQARELKETIEEFEKKRPWVTGKERPTAIERINEFSKWLDKSIAKQEKLEPHDEPAFTSKQVQERTKPLEAIVKRLREKPKPKEKKEDKKKEDKKKEDKKEKAEKRTKE